MAQSTSNETKRAISDYLRSQNLPPNQTWLTNFSSTTTTRPSTPLISQQKTALFRLLSTDIRSSIQPASPSNLLPTDIANPQVKSTFLAGPVTVQVLDIEDVGKSRWSQVETIEAQERGETTKGREIIRVVPDEDSTSTNSEGVLSNPAATSTSSGPHKLLLQDAKGTKIYGFELSPVHGVGVEKLAIGAKLLLRNVQVARGVAFLEANGCEVLGGKVEAWDKKWRGERKEVLKRVAGMYGDGNHEPG